MPEIGVLQRACQCKHRHQTSRVVADTRAAKSISLALHVQRRTGGKDGVHVRGYREKLCIGVDTWANAEDVAQLVAMHVDEAEFFETIAHPTTALLFAKRRRRDRSDFQLPVCKPMLVSPEPTHGLVDETLFRQSRDLMIRQRLVVARRLRVRAGKERHG